MPQLIIFLLACFLSFSATAQEVQYSFAGTTLTKAGETHYATNTQLLKNARLKAETPGYSVLSYQVSFLPNKGDLNGPYHSSSSASGPYAILKGELPQMAKTFLAKHDNVKVLLDSIVVKGPDGKTFYCNYIMHCK